MSRAAVCFVASRVPAGGLENALPPLGWLPSDEAIRRFPCCGVARNRNGIPASGVPAAAFTSDRGGRSCSSLGSIRTRDRTLPR